MLISCKKATELIEKKEIYGLNKKEDFVLHLHTMMCSKCKKYQRLSEELDNTLRHFFNDKNDADFCLPEEKKEEIRNKVKK